MVQSRIVLPSKEGESSREATVSKMETVQDDGGRQVARDREESERE